MKRLALIAALLLTGALSQGCGPTCEDACDRQIECSNKYLPDSQPDDCVASCEELDCAGDTKDEMLDCLTNMACQNGLSFAAEVVDCYARCD
jgi:hypothetical protein